MRSTTYSLRSELKSNSRRRCDDRPILELVEHTFYLSELAGPLRLRLELCKSLYQEFSE